MRKFLLPFLIVFFLFTAASDCQAGFRITKNALSEQTVLSFAGTPAADDVNAEVVELPGRNRRSHFQGIGRGRYHHYSRGYCRGGGGMETEVGSYSALFSLQTLIALLKWGSLAGIIVSAVGAFLGLIGLIVDQSKKAALVGFLLNAIEFTALLVLYSLFII